MEFPHWQWVEDFRPLADVCRDIVWFISCQTTDDVSRGG